MLRRLLKYGFLVLVLLGTSIHFVHGQVIQDGLIGYWPFNSNAQDESGNGNNGVVNSATLSKDRFNVENSAYQFDGINDYIDLGLDDKLFPQSLSVNVWFKHSSPKNPMFIINCSNSNNGEWGVAINHAETPGILTGITAGQNNHLSAHWTYDNYADNQWHMATFVYDVSTPHNFRFYMDGCYVGSKNSEGGSGGLSGTDRLRYTGFNHWIIGAHSQYFSDPNLNNGPKYFKGAIDDVSMYDRALTSEEVMTLYLYNYTPLDLGSDTTICSGDTVQIKIDTKHELLSYGPMSNVNLVNDSLLLLYPKNDQEYFVKVRIGSDCEYTDSILIRSRNCDSTNNPDTTGNIITTNCPILVPNAFSPNGDFINETFRPIVNCELVGYHLEIYNLWGQKVYESRNQSEAWDGFYLKRPAPQSVYVWILYYNDPDIGEEQSMRSGSVTLLR